jgi:DNA-binding MarR family transcriptional regulator
LQKLERAGFIRRRADTDDARRVQVELTEAGIRESDRIVEELMQREARLLEAISPADRQRLETLLRRWLLQLEPRDATVRYRTRV